MKKNNNSLSPFHCRLISILESDVEGWAKKIGVSATNIRTNWFNGSYPGADKLIKLIELSGISANWLLTGHELHADTSQQEHKIIETEYLKDIATLNKKLNDRLEQENKELSREVKALKDEFQKLIKKYTEYRRRGDPEDLDVVALRK